MSVTLKRPSPADDAPRRGPGLVRSLYDRFSHLLHEMGKFGIVGAATFVVDTALFNLCRTLIDLGPLTSKTIASVIAATLAFAGNRLWTWRHRSNSGLAREYFLYFVFNAIGLLIGLLCLGFSHYILGEFWPVFRSVLADNISSQLVGVAAGSLFRFYSYRRWVFLPPDAPPVDPHTGLPEAPTHDDSDGSDHAPSAETSDDATTEDRAAGDCAIEERAAEERWYGS